MFASIVRHFFLPDKAGGSHRLVLKTPGKLSMIGKGGHRFFEEIML